jgi:hypothetical protein
MKQELNYLQRYFIDNQNTLNAEAMWDNTAKVIKRLSLIL